MHRSFVFACAVVFETLLAAATTTDLPETTRQPTAEPSINLTQPLEPLDDGNSTKPPATKKDPLFPKDPFTLEQKRHGAVLLHIFGVVYSFFALAIVCDEFFVPSLDVIIDVLDITPDVAGATFMAAGGSAPELFTSIMGVFVSFDDVGIGTIVGSAVFNILFVIGVCAICSHNALQLTWWPLFRDCSFYSVSLITLIAFFRDNVIELYEAVVLFMLYMTYVTFMKWNHPVECFVKTKLLRKTMTRVSSSDELMPQIIHGKCNLDTTHQDSNTSAKFRCGLLQLMMQTLDPMHEDKVDEKAIELHALASLKALLDATKTNQGAATATAARNLRSSSCRSISDVKNAAHSVDFTPSKPIVAQVTDEDDDDNEKPLDLSWPETTKKKLFYLFTLPIILPLWLTLPDPRSERGRKFFIVTFVGSILWIAVFSYLMVWWASVVGETLYIPSEVMGLTFLAAGTSVPDLITSVIVTRKGCGDMAVSSSVGSNIFDITVGLPFPWILYNIINGSPVKVNSAGMTCSIATLFLMLIFVVLSIACYGWKMNNSLGYTMFVLYIVFVILSLVFEFRIIKCPV